MARNGQVVLCALSDRVSAPDLRKSQPRLLEDPLTAMMAVSLSES